MSIYPEGSEPRGADSTNQLLLKYAEELIATQYVDPHGFSIYPTGGSTDNAIKTGDSLQNILAKLLGASQGGYQSQGLTEHLEDLANPHEVTAAQVGLPTAAADIDAIEARDWVDVPDDSITSNDSIGSWTAGVTSRMMVSNGLSSSYPAEWGILTVTRQEYLQTFPFVLLRNYAERTFREITTGAMWTSNYNGTTWSPWIKLADADEVQSKPIPIADKASVYALTGVTVGTVYKTDDTGQVMEYLGDVLPLYGGFTIAGSSGIDSTNLGYNGDYVFAGIVESYKVFRSTTTAQQFGILNGNTYAGSATVGGYFLGHNELTGNSVHPADVVTWTADFGFGSLLQSEFTKADPASNPYNWKMDGVVSVFDNDEKQLLTNLPDTQQVEVVGEARRLERYNGDNAGLLTTVVVTAAGNDGIVQPLAGSYVYNVSSNSYANVSGASSQFAHNGTNWLHEDRVFFGTTASSAACSASVHPADADWSSTVFDGEIAKAPEATESNWSDIVGSLELWIGNMGETLTVDGIASTNTMTNLGWYSYGQPVTISAYNMLYVLPIVDGYTDYNNGLGDKYTGFVKTGIDAGLLDVSQFRTKTRELGLLYDSA